MHQHFDLVPLVSLLCIFHDLCCLPPCVPANIFIAHHSILYYSNRVRIHYSSTACAHILLMSSYFNFCDTYSIPLGLGRIFAILVLQFTSPFLIYVYRTSITDPPIPRTM